MGGISSLTFLSMNLNEIGSKKTMKKKNLYEEKFMLQKKKERQIRYFNAVHRNRGLILMVVILMIASLINIYSASYYNIGMKNKYVIQHGIYVALAAGFLTISLVIDYRKLENKKIMLLFFYASGGLLLSMPIMAQFAPKIVPRINGAIGWIRIPRIGSIQPAEVLKIIFIILMAYGLSISEKNQEKDFKVLRRNLLVPIVFFVGILLQNDLGTVVHYFLILLTMLFMSRIKGIYIWIVGIIGLVSSFSLMLYVYLGNISKGGYKVLRIKSFLNGLLTNTYDSDVGYQVRQSLIGIGSGGFLGKGYGNGIQKYSYLPEIHTDFIFVSFSEEFGFIGVMVIITLIIGIFYVIKGSAKDCDDSFGKYIAIGIGGKIIMQFIINISVAIGILPVMGIPMPFMSFGGSSIMGLFLSLGLIVNINKSIIKDLKGQVNFE